MTQRLIEKMELHDILNPKIWENNQLRPEVKEKLNEIIDQFILELHDNEIPIKVLDARLVGSNASFNYTENSDLDVHIIANFEDTSCDVPVLNLLYNFFKKNFNDKYNISIHGVPVELYVEDINSSAVSNGIYSINQEKWIKFPEPIEIPDIDITDEFTPYENKYINIMEDNNVEEASNLIDELYLLRKDSISTDGEYGKGNLIFKEFRNKGYLDSLKQLLVDETSKELSLESLNESKEDNQKLIDYVGEETANRFFKLKPRMKSPENDLYYWLKKDPIELEDFLDELESTKSKSQQRREDKLGAELLYNKDGWKVYRIDTYEAAKYYGKGTKWCISGNYPGHEEKGKDYFNQYLEYADGYYFIIHGNDKWAYLDINLDSNKAYDLYNDILDPILWDAGDTGIAPGKNSTPNFPEGVIDVLPGGEIFFNLEREKEIDEVIDEIEATGTANVSISSKWAISEILNNKEYKNVTPLIHTITIQPDIKKVPWFEDLYSVTKVIIKEGVKELGNSCFYDCEKLQEVYLPKSIKYIGNECFYGVKEDCVIYYAGNEDSLNAVQKNKYWRDTYDRKTGEIIHIPVVYNTPVPMVENLNRLNEAEGKGYHYGDLGKSEYRYNKYGYPTYGGRHTGGWGTGTYFVGTPLKGRKDGLGYSDRPEHEIDLTPYNLLTPISNENAYKLHDALLYINNWNEPIPKSWDDIYAEYDRMYDKVFPGLRNLDIDDTTTQININTKPVLEYIKKYSQYYPYKITEEDTEDIWTLIDIAQYIRKAMGDESLEFERNFNRLEDALFRNRIYVNKDKLRKIVSDALDSKSNEAPSTLIIKALGFDGIDVRHLSKDADGLSGLDNFGYGSVIFDLKPDSVLNENILNETTEETGRTVIKAILFTTTDTPKSPVSDFQDFEQDGLYKLGDEDYIAFEKRTEVNPIGWGLVHDDIKNHYIIKIFPGLKEKNYTEETVEFDNMVSGADIDYKKHLYNDLYNKIAQGKFSKYKDTVKKAIDEYFVLNENYLIEDIENMKPHYPNITNEKFQGLIELDPTYRPGSKNAGTYGKWILGIANKNNGEMPNRGHVKDALTRFEENKKYLKNKDISKFKSVQEIDDYLNDELNYNELSGRQKLRQVQKAVHNSDIEKDASKVYEDSDWEVWIPKTYEASCKLGRGTTWCTATTETDNYYNLYTNNGPLYININKHNPSEKYQFHFYSGSFMDKDDTSINIFEFLNNNPGLKNFYWDKLDEWLNIDKDGNWKESRFVETVAKNLSNYDLGLDYLELKYLVTNNINALFEYYYNDDYIDVNDADIPDLINNLNSTTLNILKDKGYNILDIQSNNNLINIIKEAAVQAIASGTAANVTNNVKEAWANSIPDKVEIKYEDGMVQYITPKENFINLLANDLDYDSIDEEDLAESIDYIIAYNLAANLDTDKNYEEFDEETFNRYIQDNV